MEKLTITPVWLDGRYRPHMLIPFRDKWEEGLNPDKQEFLIPESYYRAIGDNYNFPEIMF